MNFSKALLMNLLESIRIFITTDFKVEEGGNWVRVHFGDMCAIYFGFLESEEKFHMVLYQDATRQDSFDTDQALKVVQKFTEWLSFNQGGIK